MLAYSQVMLLLATVGALNVKKAELEGPLDDAPAMGEMAAPAEMPEESFGGKMTALEKNLLGGTMSALEKNLLAMEEPLPFGQSSLLQTTQDQSKGEVKKTRRSRRSRHHAASSSYSSTAGFRDGAPYSSVLEHDQPGTWFVDANSDNGAQESDHAKVTITFKNSNGDNHYYGRVPLADGSVSTDKHTLYFVGMHTGGWAHFISPEDEDTTQYNILVKHFLRVQDSNGALDEHRLQICNDDENAAQSNCFWVDHCSTHDEAYLHNQLGHRYCESDHHTEATYAIAQLESYSENEVEGGR